MGRDKYQSAVKGFKRVIMPVIVTILTTVLAFSSMFLMEGTMGKFIYKIMAANDIKLIVSPASPNNATEPNSDTGKLTATQNAVFAERSIVRINATKGFILKIRKQVHADIITTVDSIKKKLAPITCGKDNLY
jgi:multidrug efflux pump subunit AcrB